MVQHWLEKTGLFKCGRNISSAYKTIASFVETNMACQTGKKQTCRQHKLPACPQQKIAMKHATAWKRNRRDSNLGSPGHEATTLLSALSHFT